jgi:asparagine synthase (glutamine-hydrolysing)
MCGIAGYLNLNGQPVDRQETIVDRMCQSIRHRGPDDQGKLIMGPVALGMRRLSIIDLKTGHQPIGNETGSVWIVFNGEIYNHQELQQRIIARGHRLSTKSDTETVVHLYEEYGIDCLRFLEGMFAFALWDHEHQRLFIARDRMGEKPLHWSIANGKFIFGSEIKALLEHPDIPRKLRPEALQKYLALEYVPAPDTMFVGIDKLPPAHYLLVENGQVKIKNYWHPEESPKKMNEQQAQTTLSELLEESIRLRLIADVPLGVFLSGGIDSSLIAALAARNSTRTLKTFSIGFADQSFDESKHARTVAAHLGTEHHVEIFDPHTGLQMMEELWNFLDEPLADASIIPTYFLSKTTRTHVTVALAGEGGDELFGGYPTYQAHRLAQFWTAIPRPLRTAVLEPAIRSLPVSHDNFSFDYRAKRFIAAAEQPPVKRHLQWMGAIPLTEHTLLLNPELLALSGSAPLYPEISCALSHSTDVVSTIMQLDINSYLPDDLLVKGDRASMATSLELRLPFLAFPVVEFAFNLPSQLKIRGMTTKYLLRKIAAPFLPSAILQRPKKGFGIPVAKWLTHEFKPLVDELLNEQFIKTQQIFLWPYIKQLLDEHINRRVDRRKELWSLLMFQLWWRKFFT